MDYQPLVNQIQALHVPPQVPTDELKELARQYLEAIRDVTDRMHQFEKKVRSRSITNPLGFLVSLEEVLQEFRTLQVKNHEEWLEILKGLKETEIPELEPEVYGLLKNSVDRIRKRILQRNLEKLQANESQEEMTSSNSTFSQTSQSSDAASFDFSESSRSPKTPPPVPPEFVSANQAKFSELESLIFGAAPDDEKSSPTPSRELNPDANPFLPTALSAAISEAEEKISAAAGESGGNGTPNLSAASLPNSQPTGAPIPECAVAPPPRPGLPFPQAKAGSDAGPAPAETESSRTGKPTAPQSRFQRLETRLKWIFFLLIAILAQLFLLFLVGLGFLFRS